MFHSGPTSFGFERNMYGDFLCRPIYYQREGGGEREGGEGREGGNTSEAG